MNTKHILGTVTIIAIVGGTIYAIKKSKDLQKAEGEEISLEEARYIVAKERTGVTVGPINIDGTPTSFEVTDMEEVIDECREVADYNRSFMGNKPAEENPGYGRIIKGLGYDTHSDDIEEDEEEEMLPDPEIMEYNKIDRAGDEEENVLRHEPNSVEALNQFRRMELAEWTVNEDNYQTMSMLFDFPFEPKNNGDEMLLTQIIDYRAQFFGLGSRWVKQISYADVILHFARKAVFNCDETIGYWVNYFLEFNNLFHAYSSQAIDEEIESLNSHTYFNEERATFGLFGLTRESMDQAIRIADRNYGSVTYEIEFNEFLKSCL